MKLQDKYITYNNNSFFYNDGKKYKLCSTLITNNSIKVKLLEYTVNEQSIHIERVGNYFGLFGLNNMRIRLNNSIVTFDLYTGRLIGW